MKENGILLFHNLIKTNLKRRKVSKINKTEIKMKNKKNRNGCSYL